MPTNYKVLGQSAPSAATLTSLYTVPAATQSILSTINIVNTSASVADTVRVAIRPLAATLANMHYIVFGLSLSPGATFSYTSGVTMGATDVVSIFSTNGSSSFNVFGSEIS